MSAIPADLRSASPWRTALPLQLLLLAVIVLLYRDTALAMVAIWWRSETFNHAFLVVPISLWLIWRRRIAMASITPRPEPLVLLALVIVAAAWMMARLVIVDAASQFAFVAMVVLAVPAVLGLEVTTVILFPLLFLFFAVPFGEFVLPWMMQWTADFTVFALRLSGVPVFREGQQFVIPSGNWSVIDECSGVRYLMASFMVGSLYAYLNYSSYRKRALFMAVSLLMPIVANWVRAYLIVMLAYLSGNRLATGVDHILYGWVFFGAVIFVMFLVGARWADAPAVDAPGRVSGPGDTRGGPFSHAMRPMLYTALVGVLIVLAPRATVGLLARADAAAAPPRMELPERLADGWRQETPVSTWRPTFDNPSVEDMRTYRASGAPVGVYMAYYRGQNEQRKLVSSQNVLVPMRDPEWNLLPGGTREVTFGQRTLQVRTAEILGRATPGSGRRSHLMTWRFYWIDGRFIAGDVAAKLGSAVAQVQGHGDDGAALILYADGETPAESNATLQAFVDQNIDQLDALLRRTRDAR